MYELRKAREISRACFRYTNQKLYRQTIMTIFSSISIPITIPIPMQKIINPRSLPTFRTPSYGLTIVYAKTPQNNNKADKSASNSLNPCKAKKALSHLYDKASVHIIHDQISVSLSASLFLPNPEAKRSTKSGTISRTLVSPS